MAFVKISEQPSLYNDLEKKSVHDILTEINTEDHKVADAVQKAIPQIEKLVTGIVPRMKKGGRIFYMGAGTSGRLGVLDASEIPPTFGMEPTWVIGIIAGGDVALRNPVENAEDDADQKPFRRSVSISVDEYGNPTCQGDGSAAGHGRDLDKGKKRDDIEIEYRDGECIKSIAGVRIAADEASAIYPCFDIIEPELVTGIITDGGVI